MHLVYAKSMGRNWELGLIWLRLESDKIFGHIHAPLMCQVFYVHMYIPHINITDIY